MTHEINDRGPGRIGVRGCLRAILVVTFLLAACAAPTPSVAPPTPSPPPAPTATPRPTEPLATVELNPLLQSLEALRQVSSFQVSNVVYESRTKDAALRTEQGVHIIVGPPEQMRGITRYPDGVEEEVICAALQSGRQCWVRVGVHPWTRRLDWEAFSWLQQGEEIVRQIVVLETEAITASNELVVNWQLPILQGLRGDETEMIGRTWLQADTYLPQRELVEQRKKDGTLVASWETTYSNYNISGTLEAPVVATVTPVPTLPALERTLPVTREESPFPGAVLIPQAPGPFPAVVVLHGSEGGTSFSQPIANEFAHAGYVALALCYFDCPDTPGTVHNINVEVVMDAVDYLQARSDVRPNAVGLVGYSLGAELALIVGALDPNVRAVVSVMGSPWVTAGRPQVGRGEAWLYQGKSLPFAAIPVEQINGPVLLLHGEQDTARPVAYSYLIADRLEAYNHAYELAVYSARGHDIGLQPPDALKRIIYFLDRTLP